MARGKYSPTVTAAYQAKLAWWRKYAYSTQRNLDDFVEYDPEGFDSYGYNADGRDRAGYTENDYLHNDAADLGFDYDYNRTYDVVSDDWGFNGFKPIKTSEAKEVFLKPPMNENLKRVMLEAGYACPELATRAKELARLLINEVYKECKPYVDGGSNQGDVERALKEHFGVE